MQDGRDLANLLEPVDLGTERLSFTPSEVAKVTSISRAVVYRQIRAGNLKARRLGSRTYVLRKDLEDFLTNLESI